MTAFPLLKKQSGELSRLIVFNLRSTDKMCVSGFLLNRHILTNEVEQWSDSNPTTRTYTTPKNYPP
jgi:hypothetical protein